MAWKPTPVFLSGDSHGRGAWQATVHRVAELDTFCRGDLAHTHEAVLIVFVMYTIPLLLIYPITGNVYLWIAFINSLSSNPTSGNLKSAHFF